MADTNIPKQNVGKAVEQKSNVPVKKEVDGRALWEQLVTQIAPLTKKSDFEQTLGTINLALQSRTKLQREAINKHLLSLVKSSGDSKLMAIVNLE